MYGIPRFELLEQSPRLVVLLQKMDLDESPIRICARLKIEHLEDLKQMRQTVGLGNDRLRLGAIKMRFCNSLSGRTYCLHEPHSDRRGCDGIPPKDSQAMIHRQVSEIHSAGFQAFIHANGDREIDM